MTNIIQDVAGAGEMTEKDIVTELLQTSKNTMVKYVTSIGEATSPWVRDILKKHLIDAIDAHGQFTDFALSKGYYHPYDPNRQFKDDLKNAFLALDIETWKSHDEEVYMDQDDVPTIRS